MKINKFTRGVEKRFGGVVIFAGSDSDKEHIKVLEKALGKYGIPYEVRIASAHKQPGVVMRLARRYDAQPSPLVYIAVAGGTDALSGMLSFHSIRPVISCPPEYSAGRGVNQSCLTNPPGSSNAFVYNPHNAARFAAQCLSHYNPAIVKALEKEVKDKIAKLEKADQEWDRGKKH